MSQQSNDDLARALDGLGQGKPTPAPQQQRPAAKSPQIKIQPAPTKAPVPVARPAQPGANTAAPAGKGIPMPRQVTRPALATAVPARAARASSPLDAPAAQASAIEAKPSVIKKPAALGDTLARTMIPILLTLGFILVALCGVRFGWKSIDNPVSDVSPKVAFAIGGLGIVLWALAAAVMASVARQLRAADALTASAAGAADSEGAKPASRAARPD